MLGLERQKETVALFVMAQDIEIIAEHVDVQIGRRADAFDRRPELAAALTQARKAKCPIIAATLDTISRDVDFIGRLMVHKVSFLVAEVGIAIAPFTLYQYALINQKKRGVISQRTREALAQKKLQGVKLGNPRNLPEAAVKGHRAIRAAADRFADNVLPVVKEMQKAGKNTLAEIAEALNARGIRTARGGRWHSSTVSNLLRRRPS
jgi:DNA invertase Pin-like site-specific DNA recombinase